MPPIFLHRAGLLIVAAALFASACSSSRPTIERDLPEGYPRHTSDQILLNLTVGTDSLRAFEARASLALKTPEHSGQFSAEMRERRGDSLYVAISPGLGIEAARALVTPDSFFFYDRIKNRVVYGSVDAASSFLPEPFTSEDLFVNLLGLVIPPPEASWEVEADSGYYTLRNPAEGDTYVVDPAYWRVVRYEKRGPSDELIELRRFSGFDEFEGVVLPRRLEFRRPREDRLASIYYRSLNLNPGPLSFDLKVRSSAERVPADRGAAR